MSDYRILVIVGAHEQIEAARRAIEAEGIPDCIVVAQGEPINILPGYGLPGIRDDMPLTDAIGAILGEPEHAAVARRLRTIDIRSLEMPAFEPLIREERTRDWEQRERQRSRRGKRR